MIDEPVSRRRFLELLAGACAVAGGAGLGGILAACGDDRVGTNTTATMGPGETTTSTAPPRTTTVSTSPEMGRPLRIGVLTAKTGRLAMFGKADEWWMNYALEALPDGILGGDRKLRRIRFLTEDHRSAGDAAGEAAAALIAEGRVDILLCSGAASVVNAAAAQAEERECPCICDFVPWRPFILDRGGSLDTPFKWTYAHAYGFEDVSAAFVRTWQQLATNKKVALLFPDDNHAPLWTEGSGGLPHLADQAGYETVMPALYDVPSGDFAPLIEEFKKNGCEICAGHFATVDLVRFLKQARTLEFTPKIVSTAGALLFPQAVEAVGSAAVNVTAECFWQPSWPYSDSITRATAKTLAEDYAARTGEQWTIGIAQYAKFEWTVDVFRRVVDILDKEDTIARVRSTRLNTCLGLLDFTTPVGSHDPDRSRRPSENVYKAPVVACQWSKGSTYPFESRAVTGDVTLDLLSGGVVQPMTYEPAS